MANSIHKTAPPIPSDLEVSRNVLPDSQLKLIYDNYGSSVYSLCLYVLGDKQAAESATIEVFVRFSKEILNQPDDRNIIARLEELAISESLARLRKRPDKTIHRLLHRFRSRRH